MSNIAIVDNIAEVYNTIHKQIGFWAFAKVGGHKLRIERDGLSFSARIAERPGGRVRIMQVRIILEPSDTYTVKVGYLNKKTFDWVEHTTIENVYCDQLSEIIESLDA